MKAGPLTETTFYILLSLKQESNPALAVRPTIPPMVVALPLPFIFSVFQHPMI